MLLFILSTGCAFEGKDTVLQRPFGAEPEEILRPGLHEAGVGSHSIVWFDPGLLQTTPETDAGIDDDALLRPTMSEPAEGVRQYDAWRASRSHRLVEGNSFQHCERNCAQTISKCYPGDRAPIARALGCHSSVSLYFSIGYFDRRGFLEEPDNFGCPDAQETALSPTRRPP